MFLSPLPSAAAVQFLQANFQEAVFIYATARPGIDLYRKNYFIFCRSELDGVTALPTEEALSFRLFFFFFLWAYLFYVRSLELSQND